MCFGVLFLVFEIFQTDHFEVFYPAPLKKYIKKLPITFHNLQGYDGRIISKEINNFDVDIDVIPKAIDEYMSILVNRQITFIDSLQFYNTSLDTLASNLNDEDFKYLGSYF